MKNTQKESDSIEPGITYWSELHTCHLSRKIDPLMLDEGGRTELIDCILSHEGPRSPGGQKTRRVVFDKNFVLYRIVALLAPLQWFEAKYLLEKLIPKLKEGKSISEILNDFCNPSNDVDIPEEEDVPISTLDSLLELSSSHSILSSILNEVDDDDDNGDDVPPIVDTKQSATRENVRKKGRKKNA